MSIPNYRPSLPRSVVIAVLLRMKRILVKALTEIIEEADSGMDWATIKMLANDALEEVRE